MPASNILRTRKDGTKYFDLLRLQQLDINKLDEYQLERYRFEYYFDGICPDRWVKLGFIIFDIQYNKAIQVQNYVKISMSSNNRQSERIIFDLVAFTVLTDILFDKTFIDSHFNPVLLANARKLAELLQSLACGRYIDKNDFRIALIGYNSALNKSTNLLIDSHLDHNPPRKLISTEYIDHCMKETMVVPKDECELAGKIAAVFYSNLGITANTLKNILREYFLNSMSEQERSDLTYENYVSFIQRVASTEIESGQYQLSQLVPIEIMPVEDLLYNSKAVLEDQLKHIKATADAKKIFRNNFFHIKELPHYDEYTAKDKLYSDEDFTAPEKPSWITVKLGKLLIKYSRNLLGVRTLFISIIDKNLAQTKPLFYFNSDKWPYLKFELLLPIHKNELNSYLEGGHDENDEQVSFAANSVNQFLIKLTHHEPVSTAELQHCVSYLSVNNKPLYNSDQAELRDLDKGKQRSQLPVAAERLPNRDMQFFMKNIKRIPKTISELAEKIAAFYFLNIGITQEELGSLLHEYFEFNHINILTSRNVIKDLLIQKFDNGRYNLATIIPNKNPAMHLEVIIVHGRHFPCQPIAWPELTNANIVKSIADSQQAPTITKLPINILETAKNNIKDIIEDEANNKYLKQQLILDLLKNNNFTAEQIEQLFQYIRSFKSTLNHHKLVFIDAFLSKDNTCSYNVFLGDIKKLWLEKLMLEIENMPEDTKMGILEQACVSEISNFQRGNFFNPSYTNTRKTIEKTIEQLTAQNKNKLHHN